MRTSARLGALLSALLTLLGLLTLGVASPASAYSDDTSGGGSWSTGGSTVGTGTHCVWNNEVRDNSGMILVPNSPKCAGWANTAGAGFISTGYEVWRFYRQTDGTYTWNRGRVNLSNWDTAAGQNRVVLGTPLPRDYRQACDAARSWGWSVPAACNAAAAAMNNIGQTYTAAFREPQQQQVQRVTWAYAGQPAYNTNVFATDAPESIALGGYKNGTQISPALGVLNMLNLQTTAGNDPIARALTINPGAAPTVNSKINNVFTTWWAPAYGRSEAARFLNATTNDGWNLAGYSTGGGAANLAGDQIPFGSSLDLFGPVSGPANTGNAAPIYGTCYIELASRVKKYTSGGQTAYAVITHDDYNSSSAADRLKAGERYTDQIGWNKGLTNMPAGDQAAVFGTFRNIIATDTWGPQRYSHDNPAANTRPFVNDTNAFWWTGYATRDQSAQFAANHVRCLAGQAETQPTGGTATISWPSVPSPNSALTVPTAAVANGKGSKTTVTANVTYPGMPAGVTLDPAKSYSSFAVAVPAGFRKCANTTDNCDFAFGAGTTVTDQGGGKYEVKVPITGTTTAKSLDIYFYRATAPGQKINVTLNKVHSEFARTGAKQISPVNVCLVGGTYGVVSTGNGDCFEVVPASTAPVTDAPVTDVVPTGNASGSFTVVGSTPWTLR